MLISPTLCMKSLTIATVAGYAIGWILSLRQARRPAWIAMSVTWAINLGLFIVNGIVAGEPPFGNMYHVHVVLGLCFLPLFVLLAKRDGLTWAGGYFSMAAALVMTGALFIEPNAEWKRMPALQSPWFVPHVLAYMVSYALATVAIVMTVARHLRRGDTTRYAHAAHKVIRVGFPLMTFGMLSGALWAEEAWGRYWSWDPKETWSLITWTLYLAYLHLPHRLRQSAWADSIQGVAFLALLWTFFLVNLAPRLASALHSYAN